MGSRQSLRQVVGRGHLREAIYLNPPPQGTWSDCVTVWLCGCGCGCASVGVGVGVAALDPGPAQLVSRGG